MRRAEIVAEARGWLRTPFRPKGRSRAGLDCLGLLVLVADAFAVPHHDEQHYTDWPDPQRRMLAVFDRYMGRLPPGEPCWDGTVAVMSTYRTLPGHVGFFSTKHGVRHLIHASMAVRRVCEEEFCTDVRRGGMRLVARYGFPGLED